MPRKFKTIVSLYFDKDNDLCLRIRGKHYYGRKGDVKEIMFYLPEHSKKELTIVQRTVACFRTRLTRELGVKHWKVEQVDALYKEFTKTYHKR